MQAERCGIDTADKPLEERGQIYYRRDRGKKKNPVKERLCRKKSCSSSIHHLGPCDPSPCRVTGGLRPNSEHPVKAELQALLHSGLTAS